MRLRVERAEDFWADYQYRVNWYLAEAGEPVARRLELAIAETIDRLAATPTLGHPQHFRHPALQNLRSIPVAAPFNKLLVFYRQFEDRVEIWRIMHGARDLGRRLLEPNN